MGRNKLIPKKVYHCKRCNIIISGCSKTYCVPCLNRKFEIIARHKDKQSTFVVNKYLKTEGF